MLIKNTIEIRLTIDAIIRWQSYQQDNPAWHELGELVERLLQQHFDEADAMKQSIEEQQKKRGEE
jgi:hypothetical protein